MTKKILLASMVLAFTFSGCSLIGEAEPSTEKATKAVKKATDSAEKVTDATKKATAKVETATAPASAESALPESSMKDQVIEEVVEVVDEKTDGAATKVIESVQ